MTIQETDAFVEDWQRWHRAKDESFASPHGFLAVTGLHWLTGEPGRWDDAPGAWSTGPEGVVVELGADEALVIDGIEVTGRHAFGVIPERGGVEAVFGDAVIEVAKRGGSDLIRPRHPENPLRLAFTGTPAYEPSPEWAVAGRYVPFDEPVATTVGSVVDGLEHVYGAVGRLEFEHDGQQHALTAFPGFAAGTLLVLFSDATAGVTTYGAVRSLTVAAPADGGEVVIDFNRATNLPCAYTPHATCPLPPAGNRLPFPVEAGEQTPA